MRHWECAQEFQQSFNIRHLADRCSRSTRVSAGSCRNSHESVVALPWPQITPLNARRLGSYSLGVAAVLRAVGVPLVSLHLVLLAAVTHVEHEGHVELRLRDTLFYHFIIIIIIIIIITYTYISIYIYMYMHNLCVCIYIYIHTYRYYSSICYYCHYYYHYTTTITTPNNNSNNDNNHI